MQPDAKAGRQVVAGPGWAGFVALTELGLVGSISKHVFKNLVVTCHTKCLVLHHHPLSSRTVMRMQC